MFKVYDSAGKTLRKANQGHVTANSHAVSSSFHPRFTCKTGLGITYHVIIFQLFYKFYPVGFVVVDDIITTGSHVCFNPPHWIQNAEFFCKVQNWEIKFLLLDCKIWL